MKRVKRGIRFKFASRYRTAAYGACCAVVIGGSASAAVITDTKPVNFTGGSVTFGYDGDADFTFTDISGGIPFNPTAVGVSTRGGGAVSYLSFFNQPSIFFDPVRGSGVLIFDSTTTYASLPTTTPIEYSATPFFIGLADTTADGIHYGYGEFDGTELVSYAFQSTPGVGIQAVSAVPLPASAPMFGAALMAIGAVGYGLKRKKAAA